jgi:hypothetical protein
MAYQVVAYDPKTNKTVKRYTRKTVEEAARLASEITRKGFGAEFRETGHGTRGRTATPERRKGKRKGKAARRNPGELLILSGFVANPKKKRKAETLADAHDENEMADAFREFHEGADPKSILEVDDGRAPGDAQHLFLVGEVVAIAYEVPDHSGKRGLPFEHKFGEVGHSSRVVKKNRPLLCATPDGKHLVIVHRNKPGSKNTYRVRPEGIVG